MQVSSTIENPTLRHTFKESELPSLLESIRQEHPYCEVYLECPGPRKPRKRVLIFQNGDIGYCGDRKPTLEDYVGLIHHKINSDWIDRVFEDSQVNMQEEMSPLHFIQRLLQFRVLKKGDIIKLQISAFLLSLEPLYTSEGILSINVQPEQDRYVPVEWRLVNLALEKRQKTWANSTW